MAEVRPIDANALIGLYKNWLPQLTADEDAGDRNGVETCIVVLEDAPTLDYAPVRHGEWKLFSEKPRSTMVHERVVCSECKRDCPRFTGIWFNFCPHCGARMNGGKNDD